METHYLPPLDRCLTGLQPVISWSSTLDLLVLDTNFAGEIDLRDFLYNEQTIAVLGSANAPFGAPTEQSRRDFETRIAPIHVSARTSDEYDLEQIKSDTVWLSQKVKIDEISALRIVIVEWQNRATDLFLGKIPPSHSTNGNRATKNSDSILDDVVRHREILHTYLVERCAVTNVSAILEGIDPTIVEGSVTGAHESWINGLAQKVRSSKSRVGSNPGITSLETFRTAWALLQDNTRWPECFQSDFALHEIFITATLRDLVSSVRQALQHAQKTRSSGSETILGWFHAIKNAAFLQSLMPVNLEQSMLCELLQCLVSVLLGAILHVSETIQVLDLAASNGGDEIVAYPRLAQNAYIEDINCVRELNLVIFGAAENGTAIMAPAALAWSVITMYIRDTVKLEQEELRQLEDEQSNGPAHRHSVTHRPSDLELKYDSLQDLALGPAREDPPQYLAKLAVDDINVYAVMCNLVQILSCFYSFGIELPIAQSSRSVLFDIIRESLPTITYDENILEATIAVLTPSDRDAQSTPFSEALVKRFWNDQARFRPLLFEQSVARYPYELVPFIRLLHTLVAASSSSSAEYKSILANFASLSNITMTFPEGFRGYSLEHEEKGVNSFTLSENLPLLMTNPRMQLGTNSESNITLAFDRNALQSVLSVPSNTSGIILRDSRPFVVSLEHQHSGLHYVGILLSTRMTNTSYVMAPPAEPIDHFAAAEILALVTTLLHKSSNKQEADHIIHELSAALPEDFDFISVVAELLDASYLGHVGSSTEAGLQNLLIASIDFVRELAEFRPERMWSILAQTSMLKQDTTNSASLALVNSIEDTPKARSLVEACTSLIQTSLDDAISGLVKRRRKTDRKRQGLRFDSPMDDVGSVSERNVKQVLGKFTSLAINLLSNIDSSIELGYEGQATVSSRLLQSLEQILLTAYGIGSSSSRLLGNVFVTAADTIISSFVSQATSSSTYLLITFLRAATQADDPGLNQRQKASLLEQARSVMQFTITFLRTVKLLDKGYGQFASLLSKDIPVVTSLFASHALLRKPAAELITELIMGLDDGKQSQSIFNSLSQDQGTCFLRLLTTFDRPLPDVATECKIWDLCSAACEHNQQWFAMFLLTGSLPKDRLQDNRDKSHTTFTQALDILADLKNINPERGAAILRFVAKAQKVWIWATSIVRSHKDFVINALSWLDELKPHKRSSSTVDLLLEAREFSMAAELCDVFAVAAHASLELGDHSMIKLICQKSNFLAKHAMTTDAYNHALHRKLAENLSNRFDGLVLSDLIRTSTNLAPFGRDYKYDSDIAERLLRHDSSWAGSGKGNGFADEVARANTNFSLVDARYRLLQEWKALAITLSDGPFDSVDLDRLNVSTIKNCMEANTNLDNEAPHAASVLQLRVDLAFVLLSRLVRTNYKGEDVKSILDQVWILIRSSPVDFEVAQASIDLTYYRALLQCLFLALQRYAKAVSPATKSTVNPNYEMMSDMIEIVSRTVTTGFRALCGNLHESESYAEPGDFALLTAIMRVILSINSTKQYYIQIADAVAQSGVIRSAASLYTWSDHLANFTNQDPVYGEMAIMFLTTVSRVPQIAEHIALEGVLHQISSANLSNHYRKAGGKGPFDEPVRMFSIWVDGFLPLCLNIVEAVGPPSVAEISSFLNSFPKQLKRAEKALQNVTPNPKNPRAGAVTLGLVLEARDLVLLAQILTATIEVGAAEGISDMDIGPLAYDSTNVIVDAEALTKSSRSLRDRIVPANPREFALFEDKTGGSDDALQTAIAKEITNLIPADKV